MRAKLVVETVAGAGPALRFLGIRVTQFSAKDSV